MKCHDDLRIYQFLFKKRDVSTTEQRTLNIKACFRSLYRSLLCIYMFLQIIIYSNNKNLFLPCLPGSNFLKITKHILYNCISKSRSLYCNELVYSSIPSKYFHWPHVTLKWCQSAGLVISTNTKHVHVFFLFLNRWTCYERNQRLIMICMMSFEWRQRRYLTPGRTQSISNNRLAPVKAVVPFKS